MLVGDDGSDVLAVLHRVSADEDMRLRDHVDHRVCSLDCMWRVDDNVVPSACTSDHLWKGG